MTVTGVFNSMNMYSAFVFKFILLSSTTLGCLLKNKNTDFFLPSQLLTFPCETGSADRAQKEHIPVLSPI